MGDPQPMLKFSHLNVMGHDLHQLHTPSGRLFALAEVAGLFGESPVVFAKEFRLGKYPKQLTVAPEVLNTLKALGVPEEGTGGHMHGVSLLSVDTVESLLVARRRTEFMQPLKLALLKAHSQEAADLIAEGDCAAALPLAAEAVKQGQLIFKTGSQLQLFPLYLLAAQANLGLRRSRQCEDFLGLAGWLLLKEPVATSYGMRSQLNRLFGQLHAMQNHHAEALRSFAEDAYFCAMAYGPEDLRCSPCYFNLGKVFLAQGERVNALACNAKVLAIWLCTLCNVVLGELPSTCKIESPAAEVTLNKAQLREGVEMLAQIGQQLLQVLGSTHLSVGDADFAIGLAMHLAGDNATAKRTLEHAVDLYSAVLSTHMEALATKAYKKLLDAESEAAEKAAREAEEEARAAKMVGLEGVRESELLLGVGPGGG